MSENESKHDQMLKQMQLTIGILVGLVTLVVGIYNAKGLLFSKKGPGGFELQVINPSSQPVPSASVEVSKVQGGVVVSAETGADGRVQKQGLEPGNYSLKVAKSGFDSATFLLSVEPATTSEMRVKLQPIAQAGSPIKSAVEEVGASWIKGLGKPAPKQEL